MIAESIIYFRKRIATPVIENIRTYCTRVMSLPDSPKKIAQGVALGFAFDFLPIPIISIPLSYLAARFVRCNTVAAVCTVIFFKLAVPFFYGINLFVGKTVFGDLRGSDIQFTGGSLATNFLAQLAEYGYPFLVGSIINAVLAWFIVYTLLMYIIRRKRRRNA